jgi:hypothetical protein
MKGGGRQSSLSFPLLSSSSLICARVRKDLVRIFVLQSGPNSLFVWQLKQ